MTKLKLTYDDLRARLAGEPKIAITKLEDLPGYYVFAEFTAADDGSKAIFELESDEDVKAAHAAIPPVRWLAGPASVLASTAGGDTLKLAKRPD